MNSIIFSAIWGIVMMFSGAFLRRESARFIAILGIVILVVLACLELNTGHSLINFDTKEMLRVNSLNLTLIAVLNFCTLIYFLLSGKYVESVGQHVSEYFALIFFSLCGVGICCTFNNLLMLFLGIEIMSIPMYILTGADKKNLKSNEASLKYFLMGSFSTGILLMGIALIYGGNPAASFYINAISITESTLPVLMATGLVMLLAGLSFKVSAAPFHFWTPDVYDGAPTVFTSFMSTIVKAAGFFAFIRVFENIFGLAQDQWQLLIVFITFSTLLIGNITAVFQLSVKRMLAYSSIAQAGFMMLALFAMNDRAREGIILYAAAYSLATIGLFAILLKMEDFTIEGFNGLAKRQPVAAFSATVFLLSLTGVPLTAGFQAKFWMLMAALENGHHLWLVISAVCFAAVSAYYYFRVIQAMYFKSADSDFAHQWDAGPGFFYLLLIVVAIILAIGVYPELLLGWIYH